MHIICGYNDSYHRRSNPAYNAHKNRGAHYTIEHIIHNKYGMSSPTLNDFKAGAGMFS